MSDDISRRGFLVGAGAGLGALTVGAGVASAGKPERHNVGTSSPAAERAARKAADSIHRVLDWGGGEKTISGRFPEEALDGLRNRPGVRYVEEDGQYYAVDETLPWGVDRIDAEKAHANGETGGDDTDGDGGAHITIIDTGVDYTHPDLNDNYVDGKDFVNGNDDPMDDNGHGTHVAGTADGEDNSRDVIGVSTAANLHAAKVLNSDGAGTWSNVAAGIRWTADQGHDVGNMSFGASSASSTVKDAVNYAYNEGVLLVAAAGNDGPRPDSVIYPAAYEEVIAVSATNKSDDLASFSSKGSEVELAAPGVDILSTTLGGGTGKKSGTSMASPHVAGAGGQLMDNGYSNTEARQRLRDTAEDIGLSSTEQGYGLVDVEAALDGGNASPSVSWANPSDGEEVSGTVTIQVDAGDPEDADDSLTVEWRVDGGSWRTASYNPTSGYYEDSWDTTGVAEGDHVLDARATDSAGDSSTATITVTTENTDNTPSVSWVNPSGGETVSGTVTIQIDSSDDRDSGSNLTVEWQVDDGTWQTASYNSSSGHYEDSWDTTTVSDGDHDLDARATDTGGNTSSEARITVTVSNTSSAPTVDSYSVTEAGSPNPHAEITADWDVGDPDGDLDTVVVEVKEADTTNVVDSAIHDVNGSDAFGTDDFQIKHADGESFDVTLTVTDEAGNSASATKKVWE